MPQSNSVNRRFVLAAHPRGRPTGEDFRFEETDVPEPGEGQVLLRTLYLSLDPYMRGLMDKKGPGYAPPVALGAVMQGGTVGRVVASRNARFKNGDLVLGAAGWQDYALSDGRDLRPLGAMAQPSLALGVLGMPAFTAYVGLLDIGRPKSGETVVVGAATGAVGAVVGQLAKLRGARAVGIAGGADKCRYAVKTLGFDACIDRHDPDFARQLAAVCTSGVEVYFENVGGAVFDAVLPLLNIGARVPICGVIAHYNDQALPPGPNRVPLLMLTLLQKRVLMQGLIILDHYADRHDAFRRDMNAWIAEGRVQHREHVVDGLEHAPAALVDLLEGRNFGKLVVRVADA